MNTFSETLKHKLGTQSHSINQQRGKPFTAHATLEGVNVDCLRTAPLLKWGVFDAVEDLLKNSPTKTAIRGAAMVKGGKVKLGDKNLPINSIEGQIAVFYGKRLGESSPLRRISPVANLLVWAGLCKHARGVLVML